MKKFGLAVAASLLACGLWYVLGMEAIFSDPPLGQVIGPNPIGREVRGYGYVKSVTEVDPDTLHVTVADTRAADDVRLVVVKFEAEVWSKRLGSLVPGDRVHVMGWIEGWADGIPMVTASKLDSGPWGG